MDKPHPIPGNRHSTFIFFLFLLLLGISLPVALSGLISPYVPLLLCSALLVLLIVFSLQPHPMIVLLFIFPLLWPTLPAAFGIPDYKNWFALAWVVILLILSFLYVCRHNWKHDWVKLHFTPVLIAYSVLFILSVFTTPMNIRALSFLLQTLSLVPVYWLLTQALSTQNLKRLLIALTIGSLVNAFIFAGAFFGGMAKYSIAGFLYGYMRPIVWGVKANAWPYPSMLGLIIILSLVTQGQLRGRHRYWVIPTSLVLFAVVVINMSRSIILALAVSSIFILFTNPKSRKILVGTVISAGVMLIALLPFILPMMESVLRLQSGLTNRAQIWRTALNMIIEHPFFGIGPANFMDRFIFKSSYLISGAEMHIDPPAAHNVFLQVTSEIGIFGGLLSVGLFLLFFYRSHLLWHRLKKTEHFGILVAVTAIAIAAFCRSQFETEMALQHGNLSKNLFVLLLLAFQDQLSARSRPSL
jgi:O-antigen ligase